jgi:hypothetical protein
MSHGQDTCTSTEASANAQAHLMGNGVVPAPAVHGPTSERPEAMTTAAEVIAYMMNLNVAELDAWARAFDRRKAELQDATLWRELVADQRVNPQRAIPPSPTEWSHHRMAIFDEVQRQKAAERLARTQ